MQTPSPPQSPNRLKRELSMLSKSNDSLHVRMQRVEDQNKQLIDEATRWKYKYAQANERVLELQAMLEDEQALHLLQNKNNLAQQKKLVDIEAQMASLQEELNQSRLMVNRLQEELAFSKSQATQIESDEEQPYSESEQYTEEHVFSADDVQSYKSSEPPQVQNLDQEIELNKLKSENEELMHYIQRLLIKISKCEEFEKLLRLD